jgi:hypothetical protein
VKNGAAILINKLNLKYSEETATKSAKEKREINNNGEEVIVEEDLVGELCVLCED